MNKQSYPKKGFLQLKLDSVPFGFQFVFHSLADMYSNSEKIWLHLISDNCFCLDHVGQCVHTNHHPCCNPPNLFLSTDETSFEAGIKVQIHTQDEPPFIDQLGFGVAPGFQTFVSCQEQRVSPGRDDKTLKTSKYLCIFSQQQN